MLRARLQEKPDSDFAIRPLLSVKRSGGCSQDVGVSPAQPIGSGLRDNMMWAGWPASSGCLFLVTECCRMPARSRPARAVAIAAAEENRRRLVAIAVNCALAALLVAGLAIATL
jgi:hypothetical protein